MKLFTRCLVVLVAAAGLVSGPSGGGAAVASTQPSDCVVQSADTPHNSAGAGGIIAKARFYCTPGVAELVWRLELYMCTQYTWQATINSPGCVQAGQNQGTDAPPAINTTITKYVPPAVPGAQTGVRGKGYFVMEVLWFTNTNPTPRQAWSYVNYCDNVLSATSPQVPC